MSEISPIDTATLKALKTVMGLKDQAVLQSLIKRKGQTRMGSLQAALTQRAPEALFRLAHRFKGSSSILGVGERKDWPSSAKR
ncbi:Hpt domain-containing protein [Synechococcus sp. Nb3U1]|uniref:Hpt domain-containing protein n=1 Tax=Synechococcus sp. Nb3U1 TaxID=1914529 RepID=UPI001F1E9A56|nr:Hpt domain-containing protein [Synechococcus sp. Nb3U1]MCF2971062.1 Hpt domain-containing protein [Synechococcus sp. Nb3U1]